MTFVVQIGNSDDGLSQAEWAQFYWETDLLLRQEKLGCTIHFAGMPYGAQPWQNACWVGECQDTAALEQRLAELAHKFRQDSIAFTTGQTRFLTP